MLSTAIQIAAAAGLGAMAGLLGGLFGVGGGFLVIPLLGFFYGMDPNWSRNAFALIPLLAGIMTVGNNRFFSETIDPTLRKEDVAYGYRKSYSGWRRCRDGLSSLWDA
jgi:hypothetical protein